MRLLSKYTSEITRKKDRNFIMTKDSILQEYIMLSEYESNNKVSKFLKQKLIELKGDIGKSPIIVGCYSL